MKTALKHLRRISSRIATAKGTSPDVYFVEAFSTALGILGQQLKVQAYVK
jgi:hypothetical protein